MERQQDSQKIIDHLSDRWWRLNNLYFITDKEGNKVRFKLNDSQKHLYDNLHYFNVILKARQLGFTTFCCIYFLDACLFNSNHAAGIIAHTREDAKKIFRSKVKFAYDNLPDTIKNSIGATNDSAGELVFSNDSSIIVGTSLRSGTLQKLLVSEYGKISAKYPEKAKEIKTGALNTIEAGQQIFVESTAEGKVGEFFKLTEQARKLNDSAKILARLEPKFYFFPWYENNKYVSSDEEVLNKVIPEDLIEYFHKLEVESFVKLSPKQKAWYAIKAGQQGDDMKQEYPSTPEEAFQGSLEGAYYTKQMKAVREKGQICNLPYDARYPVYTWWDLGTNDLMTIWFTQFINNKHCFIDYEEASEQGWSYYANLLLSKGYNYKQHGFPHDGNKRMRGKELFTDKQMAEDCGIRPIIITPRTANAHQDVINHCQPILANCWFDEVKCEKGLNHLDNYRRKWHKQSSMFLKEHEHDEASHGSDSYRTFAMNADKMGMEGVKPKRPSRARGGGSWAG